MKQSDREVGDIIDRVLIVGLGSVTKEIFNQHVINSAASSNTEVVMSSDGYAMIEINGKAEVIIPTSVMGLEDSKIPYGGVVVTTDPHPLDKLIKELSDSMLCKMDTDYFEKKFEHTYQPWKKSHQDHPAFKRKR